MASDYSSSRGPAGVPGCDSADTEGPSRDRRRFIIRASEMTKAMSEHRAYKRMQASPELWGVLRDTHDPCRSPSFFECYFCRWEKCYFGREEEREAEVAAMSPESDIIASVDITQNPL